MPKIKKKLTVCFRDVSEDVIGELSRRKKLAGLVSAAFAYYVNHSDEGRFALSAAIGGVNKSGSLKPLHTENKPTIKKANSGAADPNANISGGEDEVVKRTADSLLFEEGKR